MVGDVWARKARKTLLVTSYMGLLIGFVFITTILPLLFAMLGETDIIGIGIHCGSFKKIAYWMIGYGGIISVCYCLCGIATGLRSYKLLIASAVILSLHFVGTTILLGVGTMKTDVTANFLSDMWKDMDDSTKELIQTHFSCCGFFGIVNSTDHSPCGSTANNSPIGCYESITRSRFGNIHIDGINEIHATADVYNPIIILYAVVFAIVLLIDVISMTSLVIILMTSSKSYTESKASFSSTITIKNRYVQDTKDCGEEYTGPSVVTKAPATFQVSPYHDEKKSKSSGICAFFSGLNGSFESAFYWLGLKVGKYPERTISLSLLITVVACVGLLQRREFGYGSASFLPKDSELLAQSKLFFRTFASAGDVHEVIVEDENVLKKEMIIKIANFDEGVKELNGSEFESICIQVKGQRCKQISILSLWNYNYDVITNLTDADILTAINSMENTEAILGGITMDENHNITSAKACILRYFTRRDSSDWEQNIVDYTVSGDHGLDAFVRGPTSQQTEAKAGMTNEMPLLFAGFGLLFVYISIMTGKFSMIRHRVWLSFLGVLTAGLSLGAGIGLAASITFEWSMMHLIGPFLVLGIGVDDMFILLRSWDVVDSDEKTKHKSVVEKSALVLQNAGVAITITSVTDLVAFAVGASSIMGPFRSFSIYIALCIIVLFALECTFFMGCIVIDQKRREKQNDACLPCFHHGAGYIENKCADFEISHKFFSEVLGRLLQFNTMKALVIFGTMAVTAVMAFGFYNLQVGYEPDWYLNSKSFLVAFNKRHNAHFDMGLQSGAYVIGSDFYDDRQKLHQLFQCLNENEKVDHLSSWYEAYAAWNSSNVTNELSFYRSVKEFLASREGSKYEQDVIFHEERVVGSRFPFRHMVTEYGVENANIMDELRESIKDVGISGESFPYSWLYYNMEIIKIIRNEVYRNVALTLLCVFLMVLPLMGSLQMGIWVAMSVILTIVDVAGAMYYAGLYIETSTVIVLLLTVGLAVDYAAHVGHKFLTLDGTRDQRMRTTLAQVGPAVFNGGFSTFLALSLLAGSQSYSYRVFFTIFTCVVAFGLWNGLCFLPSVLGFIGPPPYSKRETETSNGDSANDSTM